MQQFEVHSLEELESLAQQFIQKHPSGIFCVEGEMGAGKTTFISLVAKLLGEENTSSPTFSLVNEYHLGNNERMYHFDLYRVKSKAEYAQESIQKVEESAKEKKRPIKNLIKKLKRKQKTTE
jgi:tRNA threonylcarbamoyl adenosine modification protein YjeE